MGHFMAACSAFTELLPAVHDTMYSCNIKKEERDALFTVDNIFIVVLLADLKPFFKDGLLRSMDKTVLLCSTVYRSTINAVSKFETVPTSKADRLIEDIYLDEATNNLHGILHIKDNQHTFTFNRHSKGRRRVSPADELVQIKEKLTKIKKAVFDNAKENLKTLAAKEDTAFFYWSAFDLEDTASLDDRVNTLRPLSQQYCHEKIYQVLAIDDKETDLQEDVWQGYTVHLVHPKRLIGSQTDVEREFRDAWPALSRSWLNHVTTTARDMKKPNQLEVLSNFSCTLAGDYPNACLPIQILIASPSNSSPIEQSYSMLEIICAKRRNKLNPDYIAMLYILAILNLDVMPIEKYLDCLEFLESSI